MMRRKNLERAVILGLLLSTGVYGTVFAKEMNQKIQQPDIQIGLTGEDLVIKTNESALAYGGVVDIKKDSDNNGGNLIIEASGDGSNGIEAGYTTDKMAELQIYASNVDINSGANGMFTNYGKGGTIILGSEDRNIQDLTINAGGQGIDNKKGNVYVYGADSSVFTIHSYNTSGTDLNQAAINNSCDGEVILTGGSISLTTEKVDRWWELFEGLGDIETFTGDGITNKNGTTTLNFNSVEMNVTGSGICNTGSGTVSLNTNGSNTIFANSKVGRTNVGHGIYTTGNKGTINVIASATYNPEIGYSTLNEQTGYDNIIYGQKSGISSTNYGTKNVIADDNNYIGGGSAVNIESKHNTYEDTINIIAGNNNFIGGDAEDKNGNSYTTGTGIRLQMVKNIDVNIESIKGATTIDADGTGINVNGKGENVAVTVKAGTDITINAGNSGISVGNYDKNVTNDDTKVELIAENGNIKVITNYSSPYSFGHGIHTGQGKVTLNAINNTVGVFKGKQSNEEGAIRTLGGGNLLLEADNTNTILANSTEITALAEDVYGDKYAINADREGTVDIKADAANKIIGAVYAKDNMTNVNIQSLNANATTANYVASATVIHRAGDLDKSKDETMKNLKVISSLYAQGGAEINLSGKNTILTYANKYDDTTAERSVWAYDKGKINVDGYTYISTNEYDESPNSMDVAVAAGTATNLTEESFNNYPVNDDELAKVNINYANDGNTMSYINGDILAAYGGVVNINPLAGNSREANNAGLYIKGNLLAGNNGVLDVNIGNYGYFEGRADDYGDAGVGLEDGEVNDGNDGHQSLEFFDPAFSSEIYKGGQVNLTMGENARWNVTGQSWITSITTDDTEEVQGSNHIIDLITTNTDRNEAAHALTVNNFNGNATFNMSLDGNRNISDMLYIKNANGNYLINVYEAVNEEAMYAEISDGVNFDGLRFATVGEGSKASFRAVTYNGGFNNVEYMIGSDEYDTSTENKHYDGSETTQHKPGIDTVGDFFKNTAETAANASAANNIAAASIMTLAETGAETGAGTEQEDLTGVVVETDKTTNFKLIGVKKREFSDAGRTMLNMSRANYSNAIYMDRLNKRLGEARYINDDPEEDEGMWVRIRHDRIGKEDAFRSQNTMYELGYDKRQECDNGKRRVGFAVDYMHGDTGYNDIAGKGEIDRYGLWLYDTWTGNKGHYADYVAKWGHLQNDFEVYNMGDNRKVTGDYSNNVFSVSAEYGRKKDMGNDWYFEPQAQLQLARVTGANYTTSQGTKVSVDGINSLIGRAGFRIGKDFGEEKQSTLYFKADVLHEFLGDQTIRALDGTTNGWQTVDYENQGTWYDIGIGYAAMLSQSTYAFVDLEQSFGNDNDDTYQINAGVRWTF